jgi:uncharacterized membrane protein YedE/YeeE
MKSTIAVAALAGLMFGFGLAWSEMTEPARMLDFLALRDPTLAFVMGGALLVTLPGYALARRIAHPLAAPAFAPAPASKIDRPLRFGSALFGLGWGLAGICPGPALANPGLMNPGIFVFVLAGVAGAWLAPR